MTPIKGRVETAGNGAWQEVAGDEGRALRVRFVIPGESVRVLERRTDPGHADLLDVLEPSPQRRAPDCPHFGPCGGCQLQHVSLPHQLELGAERVREVLRRAGHPEAAESLGLVGSPAGLGYRSRARFQADGANEGWSLGFHETAGRRTLDIADCAVLTPELQAAWTELREALSSLAPRHLTGLELTVLPGSQDRLLTLNPRDGAAEPWPGIAEDLIAAGAATGVGTRMRRGDGRSPHLGATAALGLTPAGRPVAAALGGFVQANLGGADRLIDELLRLAEPEGRKVLELHAGAGLLSHALAEAGGDVCAFELDGRSVAASRLLPSPRAGSLQLRAADAVRAFEAHHGDSDLLVTDPPRSGLGGLARRIAKQGPERLVGVWCSLEGLERDLRVLGRTYALVAVSLIDLFPQTRHGEVVGLLER